MVPGLAQWRGVPGCARRRRALGRDWLRNGSLRSSAAAHGLPAGHRGACEGFPAFAPSPRRRTPRFPLTGALQGRWSHVFVAPPGSASLFSNHTPGNRGGRDRERRRTEVPTAAGGRRRGAVCAAWTGRRRSERAAGVGRRRPGSERAAWAERTTATGGAQPVGRRAAGGEQGACGAGGGSSRHWRECVTARRREAGGAGEEGSRRGRRKRARRRRSE
ncbi:hypothetical protein PVAP13_1KG183305 [Panicum virgatum]|uniref:Uncharacterized protein n=1 Tax=Panicum virgatum TaxID=38727 RepID=A0A8T0XFK2_PANVG|nr:hypothetical protein PVAP13_1KG183305 [Panicum virgatum]